MTQDMIARASPLWHPFTQHGLEREMLSIASAKGAWLHASDGHRIFDAISSWWVITHAHCEPHIMQAIKEQADRLDQVIFAGFTHEPAETVARRLIDIVPKGLAHVFLSDSGSTAVEVALKMALGYWRHRGIARTRVLAMEHAYHGDTVGAMSAGARSIFNAPYDPLLFDVGRIPFPQNDKPQATLDALEAQCRGGTVAAFIVEPLILGAGGMLTYDPSVLAAMHDICVRYHVLFIADEVMTGFGRTGALFACERAAITPDILCLAKGLTGGSIPLAATLCRSDIFEAHRATDRARMFFHSSSFTANPLACAAAAANLDIWKNTPALARVADLDRHQAHAAQRWCGDQRVTDVRQCGTILAFDLATTSKGYLSDVALPLRQACLARGLLIRPLGSTIYTMPPYCTAAGELDACYEIISTVIDEVVR